MLKHKLTLDSLTVTSFQTSGGASGVYYDDRQIISLTIPGTEPFTGTDTGPLTGTSGEPFTTTTTASDYPSSDMPCPIEPETSIC